MSESEIPNSSADSIEAPPTQESGWTTVNFPNAIDPDSIPEAAPDPTPEPTQIGIRVKDLEQQNQRLRSRAAELEFSLGEAHATLRAETKRLETQLSTQQAEAEQRALKEAQLSQQQTVMIAKQRQALDASRQRLQDQEAQLAEQVEAITAVQAEVKQLAQNLDQAHQVHQKQQILIETLTAQLEASQSQVAQLERDCALTKQQYDEQIQQLRQSEAACRDLRSRLHRQQQYTLQFKAALEKCLDVSATQKIEESVDQAISQSECQAESVGFVRAQPVQPWSATLDSGTSWNEPDLTPAAWATAPDDESLFEPEISDEIVEAIEPGIEPVPFEVDDAQIELPDPIVISPPLSYTIKRSTEEVPSVHHDIHLFEPTEVQAVPENFVVSESAIDIDSMPATDAIEPIEEVAASPTLALPPTIEPPVPVASPFITLSVNDRIRRDEPDEELPPTGESPSPVVYPQRSQKKLDSLAAVELPTFPKK
jgi:hypothetical protein